MTFQYPSVEFPPHQALPSIAACSDINGTSCNAAPGFTSTLQRKEGFLGGGMVSLHWCHYGGGKPIISRIFHGFSCKGLVFIELSIRTVERISLAWALAAMIHHCSSFQLRSLKTQRDCLHFSCSKCSATSRSTEFSKGSR